MQGGKQIYRKRHGRNRETQSHKDLDRVRDSEIQRERDREGQRERREKTEETDRENRATE